MEVRHRSCCSTCCSYNVLENAGDGQILYFADQHCEVKVFDAELDYTNTEVSEKMNIS